MCLNCNVVKDLYVLYEENELSEEVKRDVEAHLESCDTCRQIYETGKGFDIEIQSIKEEVSEDLEKSLFYKLKLKRMKIAMGFGILFIIILLLFNSYKNYMFTRRLVLDDLLWTKKEVSDLYKYMSFIKEDQAEKIISDYVEKSHLKSLKTSLENGEIGEKEYKELKRNFLGNQRGKEEYEYLVQNKKDIEDIVDTIENVNYMQLNMTGHVIKSEQNQLYQLKNGYIALDLRLYDVATKLKDKYEKEDWTSEDEKQFDKLMKAVENYINVLEEETNRFIEMNHSILSTERFKTLNISKLNKATGEMNRLSISILDKN